MSRRNRDIERRLGLTPQPSIISILATIVGVIVLALAVGTAITSVIVWLAWNVFGLYTLFEGAEPLTFWQVVGVALAINIVRSILTVKVER